MSLDEEAARRITDWLITEARLLDDGQALIEGYCSRLVRAGLPLARANVAQRFANPLLAAWGVIWTLEETRAYTVPHDVLGTGAYKGGPFDYVRSQRRPLHKSLLNLDPVSDHAVYLDLAEGGGTDLYALPLTYSDGSVHGSTFVADAAEGFREADIALIQATRHALAAAMEPVTLRRSTLSLLTSYLGAGPAQAVSEGSIRRGEQSRLEAVVMMSDLRGFTEASETWSESDLLEALNGYFDLVVQAVRGQRGEVLKFMGDGILSIFPVAGHAERRPQAEHALAAARRSLADLRRLNQERRAAGAPPLAMGIGLTLGPVVYGNIGSPERLDFTVLGSAVNLASRLQEVCRELEEPVIASQAVAKALETRLSALGSTSLRGVSGAVEIFGLGED